MSSSAIVGTASLMLAAAQSSSGRSCTGPPLPFRAKTALFVPVGDPLALLLSEHMRKHPPVEVTLPWMTKDGEPVTVRLVFTTRERKPLNKNFNYCWKGTLEAIGAITALNDKPVGKGRKWEEYRDKMMHALRHLFASEAITRALTSIPSPTSSATRIRPSLSVGTCTG
ncbi:hypothetical protein [Streptomyces anulatus]|uniref:hypothetical protein n=1 Tax=Streptomyces anulatus TaxID=1892 RepID=UPI00386CF8B9|nr:hypothetical protein OG536_09300 [Streptomyces anulatus]